MTTDHVKFSGEGFLFLGEGCDRREDDYMGVDECGVLYRHTVEASLHPVEARRNGRAACKQVGNFLTKGENLR